MRLHPLQGTTQQGPPVHPVILRSPDVEPSSTPEREPLCSSPESPRHLKETTRILHGRTRERWAFQQLSWSSAPLRRISPSESTQPRLTSPGTVRPQGFSPSRRLAPRLNARSCFIPVTPMGFCSPGTFPHNQVPCASAPEITLSAFFLTSAANNRWNAWRLVQADLSICSPNHLSPTGLCSGCESVPWEGFYTRNPTADSLLSFFCLSRVLPRLNGHVTRNVFTRTLFLSDRP
jgi:hypothetical protein